MRAATMKVGAVKKEATALLKKVNELYALLERASQLAVYLEFDVNEIEYSADEVDAKTKRDTKFISRLEDACTGYGSDVARNIDNAMVDVDNCRSTLKRAVKGGK